MSAAPRRVGVLGVGAVGRAVAVRLRRRDTGVLRVGGRRLDTVRAFVDEVLDGDAEAVWVDAEDATSLAAFSAGCQVVVNCAGPSYRLLDRIAQAALAAGADYVDPGGDEPVQAHLASLPVAALGRRAILSAGMMPGLTGLLLRWLAAGFDRPTRLIAHVGGRDRLTPAAAADYLLGQEAGLGEPLAAWRDGGRVPRSLQPLAGQHLPGFAGRVTAYPYLSAETERLARALGLREVQWFTVFAGEHVLGMLARQRGVPADASSAANLARASELDLFGHEPYQRLVLRLEGEADGATRVRTLMARARSASQLTGAVAALATLVVLHADVPPGVTFAADVLDPGAAVAWLRGDPGLTGFEVTEEVVHLNTCQVLDEEGVI